MSKLLIAALVVLVGGYLLFLNRNNYSNSSDEPTIPAKPPTTTTSDAPTPIRCKSLELYERFAGDFLKALKASEDCKQLSDTVSNFTHVEKSEGDYLCVRFVLEPSCYWTDGRKLQNIGHGPQLSDEQFAEVERLMVERERLSKIAEGFLDRQLYKPAGEAGHKAGELLDQAMKIGR